MVQTKSVSERKGDAVLAARAKGYYSLNLAAKRLSRSNDQVKELLLTGKLRGCRVSNRWCITLDEMERYLKEGPYDPTKSKWSVEDDPFFLDQTDQDN